MDSSAPATAAQTAIPSHSSPSSMSNKSYSYSASKFKPGSPQAKLQTQGFVVLENDSQAKVLHASLEKSIKAGVIRGTRGFDKKYYVVHSALYDSLFQRIARSFEGKKSLSLAELASSANADRQAMLAVLNVMKEDGDVIEKKHGVYALVS